MPPTRLERPAQAFLFPSEESLFGPPSSPSPEASPPRSAMPFQIKGRCRDCRGVDQDPAVKRAVSYKKARIERKQQTEHTVVTDVTEVTHTQEGKPDRKRKITEHTISQITTTIITTIESEEEDSEEED